MKHRKTEAELIWEARPHSMGLKWTAETEDPQSEWNGKSMEDIVRAIPDWYKNNKGQTIDRPSSPQVLEFLKMIGITNIPSNRPVDVALRDVYGTKIQRQPVNRERAEAFRTVSELAVEKLNELDTSGWTDKEIWARAKLIFRELLLDFYPPDPVTNEPHAYLALNIAHWGRHLKAALANGGYVIGALQKQSRWPEILSALHGPNVTLMQAIRSGFFNDFLDYWTNEHDNYSPSDAVVQYFNPKLIEKGLDPIDGDEVKIRTNDLLKTMYIQGIALNPPPGRGPSSKQLRDESDDIESFKDFHSKQYFSGGPQDPTSSYRKRGGGDANPAGKPTQRHPRFNP